MAKYIVNRESKKGNCSFPYKQSNEKTCDLSSQLISLLELIARCDLHSIPTMYLHDCLCLCIDLAEGIKNNLED
jgi:hypothetical protein